MAEALRLSEAIDAYLASRQARHNAESTRANDKSTLLNFLAVVGNILPKSLGPHHVDMWLAANADKWQASTRQVQINRLSNFQKWLTVRKLVPRGRDFLEGNRTVKVPKKRRQRIPLEEFREFLDRATAPRDRMIVATGLFLLPRVSEMIRIKWGDVGRTDKDHLDIDRRKTGDDTDQLPIGPDYAEELERWRRTLCVSQGVTAPDPDWYLMCAMAPATEQDPVTKAFVASGRPAILPAVQLKNPRPRIQKIMRQLGIDEPGTGMHTLRRSGARALAESLMDGGEEKALSIVQSMLGHASIQQTQAYIGWETNRALRDKVILGRRMLPKALGGDNVIELRR